MLQERVTIPARSEIDVPTKVTCRPWKESKTDIQWGTENVTIKSGQYVSRTLLANDRLSDVPVRVINARSEPIHLNAGIIVTDVQADIVVDNQLPDDNYVKKVCSAKQENEMSKAAPEFIDEMVVEIHNNCFLHESTVMALKSLLIKYQDLYSKLE